VQPRHSGYLVVFATGDDGWLALAWPLAAVHLAVFDKLFLCRGKLKRLLALSR
jgi:hypothetical protein